MVERDNNSNNIDGLIWVQDSKIKVSNPKGKGKHATIIPPSEGKLYINNEVVNRPHLLKEEDEIAFTENNKMEEIKTHIEYSKDKTEAYLTLEYTPGAFYKLIDCKEENIITLTTKKIDGEIGTVSSRKKIMEIIRAEEIKFGIDNEAINNTPNSVSINKILIAKGIKLKKPIDNKIKLFFADDNNIKIDEKLEKIDYKNLNSITSVKAGELLAEIIKGNDGEDGIDVFSNKIPVKLEKKTVFKAGNGCRKDGESFFATIDGMPIMKKNILSVNPLYVVETDVDIKSGNINFPANIQVNGRVTEGMKVISGGSVFIKQGVFSSNIEAKDSSKILGIIVNSELNIGGKDLIKESRISNLIELKELLDLLVSNIVYLKERNLIGNNISDGMIIKTLIESKYKNIPKICAKVITGALKDLCDDSKVVSLIKSKLIGLAPISIIDYREILSINEEISIELENLAKDSTIPANLIIEYCQEAKIHVSGDLNITGKGVFTSNIEALGEIKFHLKTSVCRGGHLKARRSIHITTVGSDAGVMTKLEIEKDGYIKCNVAYHNTVFVIGNVQHILERDSKNVHVYIEKDGSLAIDKLVL